MVLVERGEYNFINGIHKITPWQTWAAFERALPGASGIG
jgi:hypothetical protein